MPIVRCDQVDPGLLARTIVIGTSCAGKTTLAQGLAARLASPWCDLDELNWMPGWVERAPDDFNARVAALASQERWVVAGNYLPKVMTVLWPRATALVVLDYGFELVMRRGFARTLRRVVQHEMVCNGNRETVAKALSRDGILWWILTTWRRRHRSYVELFERDERPHLALIRLRGQEHADALLACAQRAC